MNVLFLTHRLPFAPNRGDRIRAYYLLREMSRFADVSLFSLVHDDEEAARVSEVAFARTMVTARVPRLFNLARAATHLLSDRPLTHLLLAAPDARTKLAGLVASTPPDVVVAYCSGMARFALEAPLARFPFVLDMVDVDSAKWAQMAERTSGPRRWLFRREAATLRSFERVAAARAGVTLVVNRREGETLRAVAPGARIEVVENGVDVEAFRPPDAVERSPVVIFCGVLDYVPNEEGLLWFLKSVWPRVRSTRHEARFAIIGSNPTRRLQGAAARDASVDMVGRVSTVQPYLWRSAVSVVPLFLARGLQNKVLEAFAAGLPAVVTPEVAEGLPSHVRAACRVATRPDDFSRAIVDLLDVTAARRAELVAAVDLLDLDWPRRLSTLEYLLREVLTAARSTRSHGREPLAMGSLAAGRQWAR
jgi:sugar transferase (PEP-CTERM/EpsH1 system associated)